MINVDGTGETEVTRGIRLGNPCLSPDATQILFDAYNGDEGKAVYSIRSDGTAKWLPTNADEASYTNLVY